MGAIVPEDARTVTGAGRRYTGWMQRRIAMTLGSSLLMLLAGAACGDDDGGNSDDGDVGDDGSDGGDGSDDGDDGDGGDGPGTWEALDDLPSGAVQETGVVALDGKIYVVGGLPTSNQVLIYDVELDEWSEGPNLPTGVHHANLAVVDGTIYVVGALRPSFDPMGNVWSWTPGDDAWRDGTPMPGGSERGASAVGVVDGLIVVAGGVTSPSVNEVSIYDPVTEEWDVDQPELPLRMDHGTGQTVDGVFYVIGGRTDGTITSVVHAFVDGEWEERAPLPTARGGIGSGVVDGKIIVVGGEGNNAVASGVFDEVEMYDPATDEWTSLASMRTPRHGMGAAGVGDSLYVPGGATVEGIGAVDTHEVLRLP